MFSQNKNPSAFLQKVLGACQNATNVGAAGLTLTDYDQIDQIIEAEADKHVPAIEAKAAEHELGSFEFDPSTKEAINNLIASTVTPKNQYKTRLAKGYASTRIKEMEWFIRRAPAHLQWRIEMEKLKAATSKLNVASEENADR